MIQTRIKLIFLIIGILTFGSLFSQDLKIKKSEFLELKEDLRLRQKSLEAEKSFLINYLNSITDIDSILNELKKCKSQINDREENDSLQIEGESSSLEIHRNSKNLANESKSEMFSGMINLYLEKRIFGKIRFESKKFKD
jgi:predicted RNA-binding protein with EMAP domain